MNSQRRLMSSLVRTIWMARAVSRCKRGQCFEIAATVFAGVLALFSAFVESVPALVGTVGVASAVAESKALDGGGLVATVFAVVIGHGCIIKDSI